MEKLARFLIFSLIGTVSSYSVQRNALIVNETSSTRPRPTPPDLNLLAANLPDFFADFTRRRPGFEVMKEMPEALRAAPSRLDSTLASEMGEAFSKFASQISQSMRARNVSAPPNLNVLVANLSDFFADFTRHGPGFNVTNEMLEALRASRFSVNSRLASEMGEAFSKLASQVSQSLRAGNASAPPDPNFSVANLSNFFADFTRHGPGFNVTNEMLEALQASPSHPAPELSRSRPVAL